MTHSMERHSDANNRQTSPLASRTDLSWQRLLGINVLNLYHLLEQQGNYDAMHWLEDIHVDDYVVEVSSLPCPLQDRERVGKVLSISYESVTIQTEHGRRIQWENGTLLRIPEIVMY